MNSPTPKHNRGGNREARASEGQEVQSSERRVLMKGGLELPSLRGNRGETSPASSAALPNRNVDESWRPFFTYGWVALKG